MKTYKSLIAAPIVLAALFVLPGALGQTSTPDASASAGAAASGSNARVIAGTATATVGGRDITASAGRANVQVEGDSARIQLDDHVVTLEADRLLVDGGERAKLPAAAKKISLSLSGGRLNVTADGREVLSESISK